MANIRVFINLLFNIYFYFIKKSLSPGLYYCDLWNTEHVRCAVRAALPILAAILSYLHSFPQLWRLNCWAVTTLQIIMHSRWFTSTTGHVIYINKATNEPNIVGVWSWLWWRSEYMKSANLNLWLCLLLFAIEYRVNKQRSGSRIIIKDKLDFILLKCL